MRQIPITVLTGFLGAGKTTLLNRILTEDHGRKFAVIVNEFGEIGIDNDLVVEADEEIFEMNNGCVCCTVRGDLIRILGGLLKRKGRFDGILLETTGLAEPSPIIQTFFMDEDIRRATTLDSVVTVVDAVHFPEQLDRSREAREQVIYADLILLNKADACAPEQLAAVSDRLRTLNRTVEILPTVRCDAPLDKLLDRRAFDLNRMLFMDPRFMDHGHEHDHDAVQSVSLAHDGPVDPDAFQEFVADLLRTRGQDIYRCKGIVSVPGSDQRLVFQGVHMMLEMSWGLPWKQGEPRSSRAVFIGRDLDRDAIEDGFRGCLK